MSIVDYSTITRLEAEPQEGPTEYKLHLLLRKRRSFTRSSTRRHISGSLRRVDASMPAPVGRSVSDSGILSTTPPPASSIQSRQHRLEQLTTQLLWRLQQSCPYHTSSSTATVVPHFPDETQVTAPVMPQRLYPGLEETKGALYEIGVADDGELVGLAEDEMEESLNNLRAMAASLGCQVEVQRMVPVGECEWVENIGGLQPNIQKSKLWAAEAFVRPDQHLVEQDQSPLSQQGPAGTVAGTPHTEPGMSDSQERTQQLRVSLTGATMSGKTSLLGTLSTGTRDNGRGKSRLSLLKHRHEIESGITSSITQELIGYRDAFDKDGERTSTHVISYGSGDVSSWVDIHASVDSATAGRLAFLSDSAGHPRFRRTTVRGLIGWDPHFTLLCIPADNAEDSSGKVGASPTTQEILGTSAADLDLSHEHLQLCLTLELPLVVVITKYDLATKAGLKAVVSRVLSALKDSSRRGCIIADPPTSSVGVDLTTIPSKHLLEADSTLQALESSPLAVVPIILTSAVSGNGLSKLHAFLRELPVPAPPMPPPDSPKTLFNVEDVYTNSPARTKPSDPVIIGGHLRYGTLSIGDEIFLGPYPGDTSSDDSDGGSGRPSARNSPVPASRSFPGALNRRPSNSPLHMGSASLTEWRRVRVTSLRNLRLGVRTLQAGQVGTVGIVPVNGPIRTPAINRIRKGMVLANAEPKAHRLVTVRFAGASAQAVKSLTIGSAVVVYFNSVRASSKVVSVAPALDAKDGSAVTSHNLADGDEDEGEGFGFGFDEEPTDDPSVGGNHGTATDVTFQFIASREFVETDAKVLVMPGGGPGLTGSTERGEKGVAGLEGFVGRVVECDV